MSGYAEHTPRPSLTAYVQCVWTYCSKPDAIPQPIAPDGRPELIVHLREPYLELRGRRSAAQPEIMFAGQLTRPLKVKAQADPSLIGVRFRPECARAFLGRDADAATDRRLDLAAVHGEPAVRLRQDVRGKDGLHAITMVEDYVEARLVGARIDDDVRCACAAILAGDAVEAPALSERQWQRRFKREVGVSTRMLQSIVRFRRVFDAIEHPARPDWVETALRAGYFDQPQMARDFRRFLGCTARAWAAQRTGLATALTVSETYKKTSQG